MKKYLFLLTILFSVVWSTLAYAEDNSGFKANMNYFGENTYRTDLLIYTNQTISKETLEENIKRLKELFPLRMQETALVLIDKNWIGIDCDSLHQQVHEITLRKCAEIWQMPVILYDVFDEDVIILGYGDTANDIFQIGHSNDSLDGDLTDFPDGLLRFFDGQEKAVQELWEESFTFESDKLTELSQLMSVPIPDYMLGTHEVEEIPKDIEKLIV